MPAGTRTGRNDFAIRGTTSEGVQVFRHPMRGGPTLSENRSLCSSVSTATQANKIPTAQQHVNRKYDAANMSEERFVHGATLGSEEAPPLLDTRCRAMARLVIQESTASLALDQPLYSFPGTKGNDGVDDDSGTRHCCEDAHKTELQPPRALRVPR